MILILMSLQVQLAVSRDHNVTKVPLSLMMISCVNGETETILQMLFIPLFCSMLFHFITLFPFVIFTFLINGCSQAST